MVAKWVLFGVGATAWALIAAALSLAGTILEIGINVAIWFLSEDDWVESLRDISLNKRRRQEPPIHENLGVTLQESENVRAFVVG